MPSEIFTIQLRTGSVSGPIVATTQVTVTDPPTFSISASPSSVTEGDQVTVTVTTTDYGSGTLYWTITGTNITNADFSSPLNAVSSGGAVVITNNSGQFFLTTAQNTD